MNAAIGTREITVSGLGNTLLGDDGVGVHVVRRLAARVAHEGLSLLDGGTLGLRLLDAAWLGAPPGAIWLIEQSAPGAHVRGGARISPHAAGLVDLLTLARLDGWVPVRVGLLGIQPKVVDWYDRLSPPVAAALPAACRIAVATALHWQGAA